MAFFASTSPSYLTLQSLDRVNVLLAADYPERIRAAAARLEALKRKLEEAGWPLTGDEALKLTVKPGVTGYAAVYGRNSLPWHDRLALDVEYVRNLSFPLDAKVFLRTFWTVFAQEGIYVEDADEPVTEQIA